MPAVTFRDYVYDADLGEPAAQQALDAYRPCLGLLGEPDAYIASERPTGERSPEPDAIYFSAAGVLAWASLRDQDASLTAAPLSRAVVEIVAAQADYWCDQEGNKADTARLSVVVRLASGQAVKPLASRWCCDHLRQIIKKHIVPNLRPDQQP